MEIQLDPLSDTPLYQQLRDRMVEAIASGSLAPGEQLASVRQLAVAFGINVATISKGYELLRDEGLISTSHKSRSVVTRGPTSGPPAHGFVDAWEPRLTTILAEAFSQGMPAREISTRTAKILSAFAEGNTLPPTTATTH
ncbi:MAG: GntR family transcriptional regulator [Lacisediminihabitans sp.]